MSRTGVLRMGRQTAQHLAQPHSWSARDLIARRPLDRQRLCRSRDRL